MKSLKMSEIFRQGWLACLILTGLLFAASFTIPAFAQDPDTVPQTPSPAAGTPLCVPAAPCAVGGETSQSAASLQPAGPLAPAEESQLPQESLSNGFTL